MFGTGRKTETYLRTKDDMKAMHGRHARLDLVQPVESRWETSRNRAMGLRREAAGNRVPESRRTVAPNQEPRREKAPAAAPLPAVNAVSQKDLERMFEKFFRMGAAVAVGELFGEGMLDAATTFEVREFLESFGIDGVQAVRSLGVTGPYLEDFACIFASAEQFPPAA